MKSAQNLERNRQKKRAIGTLDVAFKKRFFALSGIVEPELERFVSTHKLLNAYPKSFQLSGEEDAPGGQADGTPKPHNINRKKACIKFKLRIIFCKHSNPIQFTQLFADTPILGSRMPMRRETLKAIETARDNLMEVLFFPPSND